MWCILLSLSKSERSATGRGLDIDFAQQNRFVSQELRGVISDQEAKEMFLLAGRIRSDVEAWLRLNHSELLQDD